MEGSVASLEIQLAHQNENLKKLSERVKKLEEENVILKTQVLGTDYSASGAKNSTESDTFTTGVDNIRQDMESNPHQQMPDSFVSEELNQQLVLYNPIPSSSEEIACLIQIENILPVHLINGKYLFSNMSYNGHEFMRKNAPQIQSFGRDAFYATSVLTMKAVFFYEIQSTDLTLSIAMKIDGRKNSFSVAFSPLEVSHCCAEGCMKDLNQWNIHDYRKYSLAEDGVQVVQMGNIRGEVLMSTGEEASLEVRVYTV